MIRIVSPLLGTVVSVRVGVGDTVAAGDELCVIESMKMEHAIGAEQPMVVRRVAVAAGDKVDAGAVLVEGEAAVVGGAKPRSGNDAWTIAANGAALLEDSAELMAWRIGDHGFEMALSSRVPGVIERELRGWLDGWLATHGLSVDQVGTWALHPGGPRILEACAGAIGITKERYAISREVLGEFGNMSSPTILFILDRLRQRGAERPCVALGFGPGLAVEAALFR